MAESKESMAMKVVMLRVEAIEVVVTPSLWAHWLFSSLAPIWFQGQPYSCLRQNVPSISQSPSKRDALHVIARKDRTAPATLTSHTCTRSHDANAGFNDFSTVMSTALNLGAWRDRTNLYASLRPMLPMRHY